ncbi:hypothetical protein VSO75_22705, partial [Escherichia coli]|nr:hypothetical protein [Escherichia coli]MEC4160848.1 hypothetical protein [Escherichia coli]MEC4232786.1 hypothetical protein [Escherichia coli]MEC4271295.1 hypothetical protein [Escherichia coli]
DRNRSHWSTSKTPSYTKSVSWQHHPDIRSLGVGFATAMSRLGAAVSTGLLPWVLAQWGMQVTLLLLATVLLVGFVVTWLWAPETKALPLVAAGNVGGANEHSVSV